MFKIALTIIHQLSMSGLRELGHKAYKTFLHSLHSTIACIHFFHDWYDKQISPKYNYKMIDYSLWKCLRLLSPLSIR